MMKKRAMILLCSMAILSIMGVPRLSKAELSKEWKTVKVRVDTEGKKTELPEEWVTVDIRTEGKRAELLNGHYESSGCAKITQSEIETMLKMEKMETVTLQGISVKKLDMSKAKKLKTLVLDNCNTKSLNVTSNKKLRKIVIRNTKIKTLDLSQNKELTEVAVQNGEESCLTNLKTGECEEDTFFKYPEQSCKVKFAQNNKIKKLEYYSSDKLVDLSKLVSLKELYITKDTSAKVSKKWYKKNKKKLKVYSEGFLQKKLKEKKSKNMVLLKPTKDKDYSYGYRIWSDYSW